MYIYNLGQRFRSVCIGREDKIAIFLSDGSEVTFRELECLSNKIYHFFRGKGVCQRQVVAIQNRKSKVGFAAMIACLKVGIIYTNFDYNNPSERIRKIFQTAQPTLVLADEPNDDIRLLCDEINIPYETHIEEDFSSYSSELDDADLGRVSGNNPAYIMFTSGSTGIPKGVLICQRSLLNFIKWGKEVYQLGEDDILANVNPIYFDNSVFDFYCSVFNGLSMMAASLDLVSHPRDLLRKIHDVGCTFWFSVPSMLIYLTNLKLLTKEILAGIRIFAFGGEGYPKELLRKLYAVYGSTARFYNVYGPTEGTCICSAYLIQEQDIEAEGLAPLGDIASNFDYVILDKDGKTSTYGELCLMGDQLALGYYNDQERTARSFVRYEGTGAYCARMYRTGDLVERVDGNLFFRGRADNQIKHMGYRIELEEVENALIRIPGLKQCAVIHTLSRNNFSRLVAFVAVDGGEIDIDIIHELRRYVPDYMIPNEVRMMNELPKNPNGKVDRVKLKEMLR